MRISARPAHHREGHQRYTIDRVLAKEITIPDMLDARNERAVIRRCTARHNRTVGRPGQGWSPTWPPPCG